MRPPGNTNTPGRKLAVGERRVSSTSGPAAVARSHSRVAAGRGSTGWRAGYTCRVGRTMVLAFFQALALLVRSNSSSVRSRWRSELHSRAMWQ